MDLLGHLEGFLSPERRERMEKVLKERTNYLTVAIQDVYQLHNTSAVLRSCEVFGIQNVHVVEEVNLKRIDREIAMGAQKWVDVNRYSSMEDCMTRLKGQGYHLIATTPHEGIPLEELQLKGPAALLFGAEAKGLSSEVIEMADSKVRIPMYGFTESLNISVSAAIIIQELTSRLRRHDAPWRLTEAEKGALKLKWLKRDLKKSDEIIQRFLASQ